MGENIIKMAEKAANLADDRRIGRILLTGAPGENVAAGANKS